MKPRHFLFVGRSERLVLLLLSLLVLTALVLHLVGGGSTGRLSAASRDSLEQLVEASTDTLYTSKDYVGPPGAAYRMGGVKKFEDRVVLDLNAVDSLTLLKVPSIGPAFARRILSLRSRLGGYYTPLQLQEIYGMEEDLFLELKSWFKVQSPPTRHPLSSLNPDELPRHPYLSLRQTRVLRRLVHRHGKRLSWPLLMREVEFGYDDSVRLSPYFP